MFYKLANESDFQKRFDEDFYFIPEHIKTMLKDEKKVTSEILTLHKNITLLGTERIRKECENYISCLQAYEDFLSGKEVYTHY